ncbi:MAG: MAPEG family protein [Myxococcota bacterium]
MAFETLAWKLWAAAVLGLALKMLILAALTSRARLQTKTFASPEDYEGQGIQPSTERDPRVERHRRAHRNDLENFLPFFAVGAIYAAMDPSRWGAWLCLAGFAIARLLHTIFYLRRAMPHRTIAYAYGYFATIWMIFASGWAIFA